MTGSYYKANDHNGNDVRLERYPDSDTNPYTSLLTFMVDEEGEISLTGEAIMMLFQELKKDDPRLFEYIMTGEDPGKQMEIGD